MPASANAPGRAAPLFRTGELASRRATGDLVFLGRADRAARVAGERVGLDRVEAALLQLPYVTDAAAAVISGPDGQDRLAAWVHGRNVEVQAARQQLARLLPGSLVPAQLTHVASIPRTPDGMPDVAALPTEPPGEEAVAARTETERLLSEQAFGVVIDRRRLSSMTEEELIEALMTMSDTEVDRLVGPDWQPGVDELLAASRQDAVE